MRLASLWAAPLPVALDYKGSTVDPLPIPLAEEEGEGGNERSAATLGVSGLAGLRYLPIPGNFGRTQVPFKFFLVEKRLDARHQIMHIIEFQISHIA